MADIASSACATLTADTAARALSTIASPAPALDVPDAPPEAAMVLTAVYQQQQQQEQQQEQQQAQ